MNRNKPYMDAGSYDKFFKDLKELVDYLNDNKFKYDGIDDI